MTAACSTHVATGPACVDRRCKPDPTASQGAHLLPPSLSLVTVKAAISYSWLKVPGAPTPHGLCCQVQPPAAPRTPGSRSSRARAQHFVGRCPTLHAARGTVVTLGGFSRLCSSRSTLCTHCVRQGVCSLSRCPWTPTAPALLICSRARCLLEATRQVVARHAMANAISHGAAFTVRCAVPSSQLCRFPGPDAGYQGTHSQNKVVGSFATPCCKKSSRKARSGSDGPRALRAILHAEFVHT